MKLAGRKVLALSLSLSVSVAIAPQVLALGLGELSLNSGLNEPLDASIQLLDLEGLEAAQIRVELASEQEFDRAGVDYSDFISGLEFSIEVLDAERGRLHVRSNSPLTDPYLNFILDARWPSGRMMREYTLLVDLPADVAPSERSQNEAPVAESRVVEAADEVEEGATLPPSYRVVANDTLWEIASQHRMDNSVSVQQMMLAIQRQNPEAFIDDNINRLRVDRVLTLPSMEDARSMSSAAAIAAVADQNERYRNWRNADVAGAAPLTPQPAGAASVAAGDELNIVSADAADGAQGQGGVAELERQLMISEENFDRALLENQELTSRIADVDAQLELLDNIIAIEDQRIAELQEALARQAQEAAEAQAVADELETPVEERERSSSQAGQDKTGIQGLLGAPMALLGALVVLIALVTGFLIMRRRREDEARQEEVAAPWDDDEDQDEDDAAWDDETPADEDDTETETLEGDSSSEDRNSGVLNSLGALMGGAARGQSDNSDEDAEEESDALISDGFDEDGSEPTTTAEADDLDRLIAEADAMTAPAVTSESDAADEADDLETIEFSASSSTEEDMDFSDEAEPEEETDTPMNEDHLLDLATAYHEMGQHDRARDALNKVLNDAASSQQQTAEARRLLAEWYPQPPTE